MPSFERVVLRAAFLSSWHSIASIFTTTSFLSILGFTFLALVIPLVYFLFRQTMSERQDLNAHHFPFMELPPELRDMVYGYLVEDPHYPPPAPSTPGSPLLKWLIPSQWPSAQPTQEEKKLKGSWMFLANKQLYAEFTEVECKKATFHLSVTPANYPKSVPITPTSTAITSTPDPTTPSLWKIKPSTLNAIRKCDIKLVISSAMLGVPDPRNMAPDSWTLAHKVRAELKHLSKVQELNMHVQAIGDPLWNPLWVWYHASQSFKNMGVAPTPSALPLWSPTSAPATHPSNHPHPHPHPHPHSRSRANSHSRQDTPEDKQVDEPTGPKLNRITFGLDSPSPGENHLARDQENDGQWGWWCTKGHYIGPDGGADMPVREFCAKLFMECRTCRPDLESDEEDGQF